MRKNCVDESGEVRYRSEIPKIVNLMGNGLDKLYALIP